MCSSVLLQVTGLDLTLITDPDDFPIVLHGTYRRNWDSIRKQVSLHCLIDFLFEWYDYKP